MNRASLPSRPRRLSLRRFARGLALAGLPLAGLGCAQLACSSGPAPAAVARAAAGEPGKPASKPENIPTLPREVAAAPHAPVPAPEAAPPKVLPITLDTVLRLAGDQNAKINEAREKVNEAFAEKDLADKRWLPDLWVGTSYYRHEGGIQNEDGTLTHSSFGALFGGLEVKGKFDIHEVVFQRINAERKVWQKKGELSQVASDKLLDASTTYIDLVAARTGEEVARRTLKKMQDLLDNAVRLAKVEPGWKVEELRVRSQIFAQQQNVRRLQEQAAEASSRLAYLLGLDPCTQLVPVDPELVAFDLIDAGLSTCDLVSKALADGPGVRELEGLLNVLQEAQDKSKGPGQFLPVVEARMAEGIFGAGPGSRSDWDNRWDLGLQVRWDLTGLFTARDRKRALDARTQQVHLEYQDLRGKLAAGVQQAREVILGSRDQIRLGQDRIDYARRTYTESKFRLTENVPGRTPNEVLRSIEGVAESESHFLGLLRDYDKAQLQLLILTGYHTGHDEPHGPACHPPPPPPPEVHPHPGR
jgi:outer membrane protein TolC